MNQADNPQNDPSPAPTNTVLISNAPQLLGSDPADEGKLLRLFHAGLRGRYWLAILVGVVLGLGAGYAGWVTTTPIFRSTAYVQIKSYVPKILFDNEQSGEMQQYDNYLGSQAEMMRSRRVVDIALQSPEWKAYSKGLTPQERDAFTGALQVMPRPDIEQIIVQFDDQSPERAEAATAAIVAAYKGMQEDLDREQELARLAVLEERRATLGAQQASYRFQIEQVDKALGSQGIAEWHRAKVDQLAQLETAVEELSAQLANLEAMKEQREKSGEGETELAPVELEQVQDAQVAELQGLINRIRDEIDLLVYKYGPNYRQVKVYKDRLLLLEVELERLLDESPEVAVDPDGQAVDSLDAQIALTIRRLDLANVQSAETRSELERLAGQLQQIEELRSQERSVVASLAQTRARIEQLNLESTLSQRMHVLESGDASWKPVNGGERMARAGIGGGGAFVLGFMAIGAIGLVGKRVGRSDILQLDVGSKPVLGLLPQITSSDADDPSFISANASVDHIRSRIEMQSKTRHGHCLAITGPQSGSGKTTLAIALARSFADSGSNTLLIDFDVIGGGLSRHVRARHRKRLGELVAEVAGVDRNRIEAVAERLSGGGKQLGQHLIEAGLVTPEQVEKALDQQQREMGIRHALAGADLKDCSFPTRTTGLSVLPLRITEDRQLGRVGPRAIRQLFKRASEAFDVVIIDTGPIPGSVETSLAVAAADGTVVIVSKNDLRSDVKASIETLDTVGGTLIGLVMNRVTPKDMKSSRLSQSLSRSSQSVGRSQSPLGPIDLSRAETLGVE